MADRYWVGGSGNWDASSTANWSTSSGGSAGASAPTSADNVIFDANSNVGTGAFTVTVTGTSAAPAVCNDFSTGGAGGALDGAMTLTMGATAVLSCHGSITAPATNFSTSGTAGAEIFLAATSTGKTITTNGVAFTNISFRCITTSGEWTLGSALTASTLIMQAGTFITSNYNMTIAGISKSSATTAALTLGSSAVSLSNTNAVSITAANLTLNAGTSTITCSATSPAFTGGGLTYYNVTFSSAASGTTTINDNNTFNNLTQTSRSATGVRVFTLGAAQTVSGTLTLGAANTAVRRILVQSSVTGTRRTITLNGTLATLADVDFRDIGAAGTVATPWTGTRLGNGLNNNNITFDAPKTVYWNLSGTRLWSDTGWATTNNGVPAANNFPLAQDTAVFTEAGAAGTIDINFGWYVGELQMADGVSNRTTAFTLIFTSTGINFYKNVTFFSNLISSGTGTIGFRGQGTTQVFTSAGVSLTCNVTVDSVSGTLQLADNLTSTGTAFTLTSGTLDLSSGNRTLTCVTFSSSNSNTRSISFGTGNITVTGNAATIFTTATATGFTVTGTPVVNATYSGSTGTRGISFGNAGEANAISVNVTAGTDQVNLVTTGGSFKNIDFTGFSGTMAFSNSINIFGNFTLSTGMTVSSGTQTPGFLATSGTQQITTNGKTIDYNLSVNAPGATVRLQDNLTLGSTRTFQLLAGTLDLSSGNRTLSAGLFSSSNSSNTRSIAFGTGQITVTGNNTTVFDIATSTGFTYTGTSKIEFTYAGAVGTRNIRGGEPGTGGTESNSLNYLISAGSDIVAMGTNARQYRDINLTGFSGTFSNAQRTLYGSLTISSGTTVGAGVEVTTFAATSGTQNITSNGKTLDFPIIVNAPGATVQLQDALALGSTRTLTLTAGTLNANNQNCTTGLFASSNTNVRTLTMGSGTWTIQGAGTAWDASTSTNLTVNGGTSTITMTSASAKTFAGGNKAYYILNQGGAGALTITGSNTFTTLSTAVLPTTITFTAGTTQSVGNFNLSGTSGNLVTINSTSSGSQFNLYKISGSKALVSYMLITDSAATPSNIWFSPTSQGNVNGGNNTGWNFNRSGPALPNGFLLF